MAQPDRLTVLPKGTRLLFGGDRLVSVPDSVAERFRPGDAVVVVDHAAPPQRFAAGLAPSAEVLLIPAAERSAAAAAVTAASRAFAAVAAASDASISRFFDRFAHNLESDAIWSEITAANTQDVARAQQRGRSTTRLAVSDDMRAAMIAGLRGWIEAKSRRGQVLERVDHPDMRVELIGAALGVVAFVFEGRPNVLADATGVLRGGNTVVFRIGSDALGTARVMMRAALTPALVEAGLPEGAVCLVDSAEHAAGWALFSDPRLSLAGARGSGPAVATLGALARQAGVAVSLHGTGGAWIVAARSARAEQLGQAVFDSLDRKVCNTLNTLCIVRERAGELVAAALRGLERAGDRLSEPYKLHVLEGDRAHVPAELFARDVSVHRAQGARPERQAELLPEAELGREWEWEHTPEVTLAIVDSVEHAVELCNRHGPQFIAGLLSEDEAEHERFYAAVNTPFVCDGQTRWVDGQKALHKPELGLSNWQWGRLFGRGGILSGDSVYTVRTRARRQR